MEDQQIIELYWARSEQAIRESETKYGAFCLSIARNILAQEQDAEECVNDTWLRAWNAMPPQRPGILSAFFGKLTRNLSLDRWRYNRAAKRGGPQVETALEELGGVHPRPRPAGGPPGGAGDRRSHLPVPPGAAPAGPGAVSAAVLVPGLRRGPGGAVFHE